MRFFLVGSNTYFLNLLPFRICTPRVGGSKIGLYFTLFHYSSNRYVMEHPAFTLASLCAVGGTIGYFRKGSLPSLVAGATFTALYGYSGYLLKNNSDWGLELALGTSSVLFAAGCTRSKVTNFRKPVPIVLLVIGGLSTLYYGKKYNEFYPIF